MMPILKKYIVSTKENIAELRLHGKVYRVPAGAIVLATEPREAREILRRKLYACLDYFPRFEGDVENEESRQHLADRLIAMKFSVTKMRCTYKNFRGIELPE